MAEDKPHIPPAAGKHRVVRKIAPSFRVYREGTFLRNFKLNKSEFIIGSHPQCDILIEGREVSARHCALRVAQGRGIFLVHLKGGLPTRLNGEEVADEKKLSHGDRIQIGPYSIAVSLRIREETHEDVGVARLELPHQVLQKLPLAAAETAEVEALPPSAEEATEYAPLAETGAVEEKTIVDIAQALEQPEPPPNLDEILAPLEEVAATPKAEGSFAVPFDESAARHLPQADSLSLPLETAPGETAPGSPPPAKPEALDILSLEEPSAAAALPPPGEEASSQMEPLPPPEEPLDLASPPTESPAFPPPVAAVSPPPKAPRPAAGPILTLVFVNTERRGEAIELSGQGMTIGRRFGDLLINDSTVSKRHLRLTINAAREVHIQDLNSSNGTYLNGQRISEGRVRPGDKLELGRVMLQLLQREVPRPASRESLNFEETELLDKKGKRAPATPERLLTPLPEPSPESRPLLSPFPVESLPQPEPSTAEEDGDGKWPATAAPKPRRPWKKTAQWTAAGSLLLLLLLLLFFSPLNRLVGLKEAPEGTSPAELVSSPTIVTATHPPPASIPGLPLEPTAVPTPLPTPVATALTPPSSAPPPEPLASAAEPEKTTPPAPEPKRRKIRLPAADFSTEPTAPAEAPARKTKREPVRARSNPPRLALETPPPRVLPLRTPTSLQVPPPTPLPRTGLPLAMPPTKVAESPNKPISGELIKPLPTATPAPAATVVITPLPTPTPTATPPALTALDNALGKKGSGKPLLQTDLDKASKKLKNNDRRPEVKVAKQITVDDINRSLDVEVSLPMLTEEKIKFGPLPIDDFRKQLKARIRVANICYFEELQRDARASGKITVSFTVKASGQLTDASIVRSAISSPALLNCLKEKINAIRLSAGPGEDLNVFYNFKFKGTPQLIDFENPA